MEFKRGMFGYSIIEVQDRIKATEAEIAAKKEQAEGRLAQAAAENRELMEQLKTLYARNAEADEFDAGIGSILREAFIRSSEEVYNFKNQADNNISLKYDRLESLKENNSEVNESIDKLLVKLVNIEKG